MLFYLLLGNPSRQSTSLLKASSIHCIPNGPHEWSTSSCFHHFHQHRHDQHSVDSIAVSVFVLILSNLICVLIKFYFCSYFLFWQILDLRRFGLSDLTLITSLTDWSSWLIMCAIKVINIALNIWLGSAWHVIRLVAGHSSPAWKT